MKFIKNLMIVNLIMNLIIILYLYVVFSFDINPMKTQIAEIHNRVYHIERYIVGEHPRSFLSMEPSIPIVKLLEDIYSAVSK